MNTLLQLILGLTAVAALQDRDDTVTSWLPRDLEPLHYRVHIQPVLEEGNFTAPGHLEFTFRPRQPTARVTLNARDLAVDSESVTVEERAPSGAWASIAIARTENDTSLQTYTVELQSELKPAAFQYRLKMKYVARVADNLKGLYRVSYQDENNNQRWMAMTQLHPTNARAMFPCLDEPQYKAKFTLSVARQESYISVANMKIRTTEPMEGSSGWVWDHFETSVPMSSYLIALAVFDFGKVESADRVPGLDGNVTMRVFTKRADLPRAEYAARVGPKVLRYFSEVFNLSFPLAKQDMVAAPKMTFSAMENWGLIFYREQALLVDPADPGSQHYVGQTVAHELAHQWFGNLVTMKWWNDVWLNEGFATYMSQLGLSHVEPQWKSEDMFVLENMQEVMQKDALASSHPVSRQVYRVADIDHIFDAISYKKGSSEVRMMSRFLGAEAFSQGLNEYLRKHAYGNAAQDDLWAALTAAARRSGALSEEQTVKDIMDTWTLRTGFPIVTVTRDYCRGTANVTQQRFLTPAKQGASEEQDCCWRVPLWVDAANWSGRQPALHWLPGPRLTLQDLPGGGHWLLVNGHRAGFYRVNYDARNWRLLTADLAALSELQQAGLVDDALALAGAGRLGYDVPVELVRRLPRDRPSLAWVAALPWLSRMNHLLFGQQLSNTTTEAFSAWSRHLAADLLRVSDTVRASTDPVEHAFNTRVRVWACALGVPNCLGSSLRSEDANICGMAKTSEEWNRTLTELFKENSAFILKLAECVQSDAAAKRILELSFFGDSQELSRPSVIEKLAANPHSYETVLQFLNDNWEHLQERHGDSYNSDIIKAVTPFIKSDSHQSKARKIFSNPDSTYSIQSVEEGNHNIWWLQNQAESMLKEIPTFW